MNGKAVQLVKGEKLEIEVADIDSLIEKFKPFGRINVIDLDAAKGEGSNLETIKKIVKKIKCRVGGGIRTVEKAEEVIKAGAEKVIVSSVVFKDDKIDYQFLKDLTKKIKKEQIIIALDSKKEEVVIKGWRVSTGMNVFDAIKELSPYCSEFLCTYVDKEGMMQGTNLELYRRLRKLTKNDITAAGGITTIEEVKYLEEMKVNSALGMAIYTGRLSLEELKKIK
jgi:phosphoribosylformimino-5-aminoimidazole carboxamide ribotide isomerase